MDRAITTTTPSTLDRVTSGVIRELASLGRSSKDRFVHATELARALSIVSSPCARVRSIPKALDDVTELLQRHRLYGREETVVVSTSSQRALLARGLRLLWMHVTTSHVHAALIDLIRTISFLPRSVVFWKHVKKSTVRELVLRGPVQWLLTRAQRISLDERIRSLETTLDAQLRHIGLLKQFTTECANMAADNDEELATKVKQGLALLQLVYSTKGMSPPRKGHGVLMAQEALLLPVVDFDDRILDQGETVASSDDVVRSLRRVEHNLSVFWTAQTHFARCFQTALAPCRPPSKLRQRWLQVTSMALCLVAGGVWISTNQTEFRAGMTALRLAAHDFLTEHMLEPLDAIVREVVLNQKPEIQDAMALVDTKESLRRMLADFVRDTTPNVPNTELQRIMDAMDMSVVSLQYEKQLAGAVRNLFTGDIVRMLLIQVQFIKKELLVAMGAIDDLMHANQLNLQLLATIPTFLVAGGLYTLVTSAFHLVFKRLSDRLYYDASDIAGFVRTNLRDIERLLNKQHRGAHHDDEAVLGVRDLGLLLLLLHQVRELFESYRSLFPQDEHERFQQDLDDLVDEGVVVSQQLAVIQRMYHTYPFLYASKRSKMRWLFN